MKIEYEKVEYLWKNGKKLEWKEIATPKINISKIPTASTLDSTVKYLIRCCL